MQHLILRDRFTLTETRLHSAPGESKTIGLQVNYYGVTIEVGDTQTLCGQFAEEGSTTQREVSMALCAKNFEGKKRQASTQREAIVA